MSEMSGGQVVDSKIVELSFENKDFETNARQSISTLDKLKKALNFSNSTKGLDEINNSIEKVKINPLINGVGTLHSAIDGLADTIGFAAIVRYTNKALDSIERLGRTLTTANISSGWQKYADKTTSVATLVSQGYDIDTVTDQLERLNWFTDETSYNFVDMVGNIGKFTAAGQGLEDSVTAMEGIANWAAMSGQNAQAASHAMYQLSQAMGAGVMRKEDYKSIQNVSMDTVEFRQHALDAAVALGTLKKTGEDTYKSLIAGKKEFTIDQFAEHLTQDAWFTSDVMMAVFKDYSAAVDQIYDYAEAKGITASEAMEELGGKVDEFGLKAFQSAQQARTLQDAIGSIQDAASTTWMNIFEAIFGNANEATDLWTAVANEGYDIFVGPLNNLYDIVTEAFGGETPTLTKDMWQNLGLTAEQAGALAKRLMEVGEKGDKAFKGMSVDDFIDSLDEGNITVEQLNKALAGTENSTVSNLEDIRKKALEVIKGNYGNDMSKRFQMITEECYDAQKVQDYVNVLKKLTNGTWEITDATLAEADAALGAAEDYSSLTDEQLKAAGWTPGQIQALRELEEQAKKTGTPLNELVETLSTTGKTGKQTFFDAIRHSAMGIGIVFEELKAAFDSVFSIDGVGFLNEFISGFDKLGLSILRFTKQNAGRFKATFTGIFSVFDLGLRVVQAFANTGLNVLGHIFDGVGIKALNFTAKIGNSLKTFHDWVVENELIEKSMTAIGNAAIAGIDKVKGWFDSFLRIPIIQANLTNFKSAFRTIFDNLVSSIGGGTDAFQILFNSIFENISGLREGKLSFGEAFKNITDTVKVSVRKLIGDDGIKSLRSAFKALNASFTDFVSNLGKNKDGTLNAFGKLQKVFGTTRESVKTLFGDMKTHLTDLVSGKIDFKQFFENLRTSFQNGLKTISEMGGVDSLQEVFSNLKTSISTFFDNLGKNEDGSLNKFGKLKEFFGNTGVAIGQFFDKVRTNVSDLSSGKIDLKAFFVNLKEDFEKGVESLSLSDGLEAIKKKFEEARTSVVNFLDDLGTNEDGTANAFGKLWNGIKNTFGKAVTKISAAKTAIGEFFTKLDIVGIATRNFDNLKNAFGEFFTNLPNVLGGVKGKFEEFITKVTELGGFKFENIPKIFESFKDTVGAYFEDLDIFEGIKKAFGQLWDDLAERVGETGVVEKITEIFNNLKNKIKEALVSVGINIDSIRDKIVSFFERIKAAWDQYNPVALFEKLKAFLQGKEFTFGSGSGKGLSFSLTELISKIKGLVKLTPFISAIGRLLTGLAMLKGVKLLQKEIQPTNFLDLAKSIGILAASLAALVWVSKDNPDQLIKAAEVLGAITIAFAGISFLVSRKFFDSEKIKSFATSMEGMCKGLLEVILAMYLINNFKPGKNLGRNLMMILGVLSAMAAISALMSWFSKKDTKPGGVADLADAMVKLVGIMVALDNYKVKDADNLIENYKLLLFGVAGILAAFKLLGGDYKGISQTVKSIALSFLMIAGAVALLSNIDVGDLDSAVSALDNLALCMGGLLLVAHGLKGGTGPILALAVTIGVIAMSLKELSKIDDADLDKAATSIDKVMLVLTLLAGVIGFSGLNMNPGTAIAIIGVLALLAGVVSALWFLQSDYVDTDKVISVMNELTKIFGALSLLIGSLTLLGNSGIATVPVAVTSILLGLGEIALVATAIGGVVEWIKENGHEEDLAELQSFFDTGVEVLTAICNGIGRMIGGFLGGIVSEGAGALPEIMDSVLEFFDGLQKLNELPDLSGAFEKLSSAADIVSKFGWDGFFLSLGDIALDFLGGKGAIETMTDGMEELVDGYGKFAAKMSVFGEIPFDDSGLHKAMNDVRKAYKGSFTRGLQEAASKLFTGKGVVENMAEDMEGLADGYGKFAAKMSVFGTIEFDDSGLNDAMNAVRKAYKGSFTRGLQEKANELLTGKGVVENMADDMQGLADGFGKFAEKMKGFEQYGEIDTTGLVSAIQAVQTAYDDSLDKSISDAIEKFVNGRTYVEQLCMDALLLAGSMRLFSITLKGFKGPTEDETGEFSKAIDDAVTAINSTKEKLSIFDGMQAWLDAKQLTKVGRFSLDVLALTAAMNSFKSTLAGFKAPTQDDVDQFNEALTQAQTAIDSVKPKEFLDFLGDWLTDNWTLDGQSYIETFSGNVKSLGDALSTWNEKMGGFAEGSSIVVPDFSGLISAMNQMNEGGLFGLIKSVFVGDSDFSKFATNIGDLGEGLADFAKSLEGVDVANMERGIEAAKKIMEATTELENSLFGSSTNGETVLDVLGSELAGGEDGKGGLGAALNAFVGQFENIGDLSMVASAVRTIANATKTASEIKITGSDIINDSAVEAFCGNLKKVSEEINGLTEPDTSIIESFKEAINSLSGIVIDTSAFIGDATKENAKGAGKELASMVGEGFGEAVETISSALKAALATAAGSAQTQSVSKFQELGRALGVAISEGITKSGTTIVQAAKDVAERGGRAVKMARPGFYAAGAYLCEGLAAGIRDNGGIVTQAAIAMAKDCLAGMKGAMSIASPSKATKEMGYFLDAGLANGIRDNIGLVTVQAMNLGDRAVAAVEGSIKKLGRVKDTLGKGVSDATDDLKLRVITKIKSITDEAGSTANKESLKQVSKVVNSLKEKVQEAKTSDLKLSPEIDTAELESGAASAESTVDEVKNKTDTSLEQALAKLRKVRSLLKSEIEASATEMSDGTKKAVAGSLDISTSETENKYGRVIGRLKNFVTGGVDDIGRTADEEALKKVNKTIKMLETEVGSGAEKVGKKLKDNTKTAIGETGEVAETETEKTTTSMADGIDKGSDKVVDASAKVAKAGAKAAADEAIEFEKAGKDLAEGLAKGIDSGTKKVTNASGSIGEKMAAEIRELLKIHSPSKVTEEIGEFFDLGLAKGIWNKGTEVTRSTAHVGRLALESIQHTVNLISQVANDEIDITPTVRPVVDLSDIKRNGNRISDYLNLSPTVTIEDSLGKISQISDARRNDTTNSDLLYALRELKDTVNTTPSNTYNINGITYDDGSNVAAAVGSLIRAARIERRA